MLTMTDLKKKYREKYYAFDEESNAQVRLQQLSLLNANFTYLKKWLNIHGGADGKLDVDKFNKFFEEQTSQNGSMITPLAGQSVVITPRSLPAIDEHPYQKKDKLSTKDINELFESRQHGSGSNSTSWQLQPYDESSMYSAEVKESAVNFEMKVDNHNMHNFADCENYE